MQTLKMALGFTLLCVSLTGCALLRKQDTTTLRIYEQVESALPRQNAMPVEIPLADLKLSVSPFPILTEKNISSAELYNTAGGTAIFVRFDIHGAIVLDEATTRTRGQYLVTFLNNRPVAAWLVNQRILNGQFLVEGDFTDEEAKKAVAALNQMAKANRR
jgi:preprotein translocase subunit SecD